MKAVLVIRERYDLDEASFVELVVWLLPQPLLGSTHRYKYRLALVCDGVCAMRYDNEAGKGDHKHLENVEVDYVFAGIDRLEADFWADVE